MNTVRKGKDVTIEITKQVTHELGEIVKQTGKEAVEGKKPKSNVSENDSSVAEAMQQRSVDPSDFNEDSDKKTSKERLDYLEKELEDLKIKRQTEAYQAHAQEQLRDEEEQKETKLSEPIQLPKSPKKGPHAPGDRKVKGTGEIIRSKK